MVNKLIKSFRLRAGITASELANRIGCTRQYLSLVESGKESPSKILLSKITVALRLSPTDSKMLGIEMNTYSSINSQNQKMDTTKEDRFVGTSQPNLPGQGISVEIPNNLTVSYTDFISLTWTEYGVVLDFGQKMGPTNKVNIVSRVGMSKKHAESFYKLLETELKKMKD